MTSKKTIVFVLKYKKIEEMVEDAQLWGITPMSTHRNAAKLSPVMNGGKRDQVVV